MSGCFPGTFIFLRVGSSSPRQTILRRNAAKFLEAFQVIDRSDAMARERVLSPEARLQSHEGESSRGMEENHA